MRHEVHRVVKAQMVQNVTIAFLHQVHTIAPHTHLHTLKTTHCFTTKFHPLHYIIIEINIQAYIIHFNSYKISYFIC